MPDCVLGNFFIYFTKILKYLQIQKEQEKAVGYAISQKVKALIIIIKRIDVHGK